MGLLLTERFATIKIKEVISVDQEKGIKTGDVFPAIVSEFEGEPVWKVSFYHNGNACVAWLDNSCLTASKHLTKCDIVEHPVNSIVVRDPHILN